MYNNLNNMNSHGVLDKRAGNSVLKKWSRHLLGGRLSKREKIVLKTKGRVFSLMDQPRPVN